MSDFALRPAEPEDAAGVAACVCEAYVHYIERIGKQPGPMLEDYSDVIKQSQVHVAMVDGRVVGAIVLQRTAEGFYVDNVAVRSSTKGAGVGRRPLEPARQLARQPQGTSWLCGRVLVRSGPVPGRKEGG